jgi:tetratricopeptide (TPR) repeat protein
VFHDFLRRHPDNSMLRDMLLSQLSCLIEDLDDSEESINIYKFILSLSPDYPGVYKNLLNAYLYCAYENSTYEILDEARDAFRRALEQDPDDQHIRKTMAEIYFHLAEDIMYCIDGPFDQRLVSNLTEAILAYKNAIRLYPDISDGDKMLAGAYRFLTNDCQDHDDPEPIIRSFKEIIIKSDPNDALAHYNLGLIYFNLSRYEEAITSLWKAIDIDPSFMDAHFLLGKSYVQLKDRNAAMNQYEILRTVDDDLAKQLMDLIRAM